MKVSILNLKRLHESIKPDIDKAIADVFNMQNFILGSQVSELETKVADYIGTKHAVGVASGTDALVIALKAAAYKMYGRESYNEGDEIITTPFTFVATGDSILLAGAKPVFVGIDPGTCNINTEEVKKYISESGSRVVGILPVHIYGQSCDMHEIMEIAKENNLCVIEDVAQAFGGEWEDKKLGSIGGAGCMSFFPSKNLGCFGDGGMVVTNDDVIAGTAGMLRKHGGKDKYNVDLLGHNSRLDTLQASILLAKIKYIDLWNNGRRNVAAVYNKELSGIDGLVIPADGLISTHRNLHVYHQYTCRTDRRDALQAFLKERGVVSMVYYPVSLHKQKLFMDKSVIAGDLQTSEQAVKQVLSLPIDPLQNEEETMYVVEQIKEFFAK